MELESRKLSREELLPYMQSLAERCQQLEDDLAAEKKLSSAISRDCNDCANARNEATAERDTLKALCVEWKPIETAPQCGVFLVYLEAEMLGSRIHVANWHLNVKIVGGVFSFDAPNPTHWQPLPPPPCGSEGK